MIIYESICTKRTSIPRARVERDGRPRENDNTQATASALKTASSTRLVTWDCAQPCRETRAALVAELEACGCEVSDRSRPADAEEDCGELAQHTAASDGTAQETFEATLATASGQISLSATVAPHGDAKSTLGLLRGKGDILAYAAFQQQLVAKLKLRIAIQPHTC